MALSREEVASRYGTALFGYAQDMKVIDKVYDELQILKRSVSANSEILTLLSDPLLKEEDKQKTLIVIEKDFCEEVQGFLNLLLEYGRFENLLDIIDKYNELYDKAKAIASGTAITAIKLDDGQLTRLSKSIAKKYHLNAVRLKNQVDPSILGGVILQVQDRVIDGSVKNKLKKIRAQLINKN